MQIKFLNFGQMLERDVVSWTRRFVGNAQCGFGSEAI